MIEIAFSLQAVRCFGGPKVIRRAQGEVNRGWQDKSRKVRPVGRSGNASKFNQARNIAKTGRNLPFLIERCSSSAFGTFGRIR